MTDTELNIVDFSRYKIVPIDSLIFADWNYKENDPELTVKLVENIKRNGQIENLLVRTLPTGVLEVVNGNHRLEALQIIGCKNAVVYDLGPITQHEAYRIAIETNETKFVADQIKLAQLVKEMSVNFTLEDLATTLPYNQDELNEYLKLNSFDFNDYDKRVAEKQAEKKVAPQEQLLRFVLDSETEDLWQRWLEMVAQEKSNEGITPEEAFKLVLRTALDNF